MQSSILTKIKVSFIKIWSQITSSLTWRTKRLKFLTLESAEKLILKVPKFASPQRLCASPFLLQSMLNEENLEEEQTLGLLDCFYTRCAPINTLLFLRVTQRTLQNTQRKFIKASLKMNLIIRKFHTKRLSNLLKECLKRTIRRGPWWLNLLENLMNITIHSNKNNRFQ